ncbi:hypothetical protein R6Q59_002285 [Mikania micrantha]
MKSSYLTVDFFRKLPQEGEKMGPTPSPGDRRNPPGPDRMNPSYPLADNTLRITTPKAVVYCQVKEAKQNLLSYFYTQIGRRELWLMFKHFDQLIVNIYCNAYT